MGEIIWRTIVVILSLFAIFHWGFNDGYNYLWEIYTGKRPVKTSKNPFLRYAHKDFDYKIDEEEPPTSSEDIGSQPPTKDSGEDFRSELISTIQRVCSGGVIRSWAFVPNLVKAIVNLHNKYKG